MPYKDVEKRRAYQRNYYKTHERSPISMKTRRASNRKYYLRNRDRLRLESKRKRLLKAMPK